MILYFKSHMHLTNIQEHLSSDLELKILLEGSLIKHIKDCQFPPCYCKTILSYEKSELFKDQHIILSVNRQFVYNLIDCFYNAYLKYPKTIKGNEGAVINNLNFLVYAKKNATKCYIRLGRYFQLLHNISWRNSYIA